MSNEVYYWLAINGASCSASGAVPLPRTLRVYPTPEQLIGYKTRDEQLTAQRFLLTAPIEHVEMYMAQLPHKIDRGEVVYVRPKHPQPPTCDPTMWMIDNSKTKALENNP